MSLIDTSYFVLDVSIPNPAAVTSTLASAITRYEPEILEYLLGYALAKLVIAYNVSTSPQRIKDIVEGKEYLQGTHTVNWNGLINTRKVSLLSNYTYIEYVKNKSLSFQNVGVIESMVENGVNVGPSALIQRASLSLRELAGYYGQNCYSPSLFNFLRVHESDYPELIWNSYRPVNALGI